MKKKSFSVIGILLSVLLGAFFIFSAWTKTRPNLQYFEFTIHNQVGLSDLFSSIAARFFVGLEAALGLMMLITVFGKRKWVLKACIALLVAFSVYLILLWINQGSNADCGCMGNLIKMNPWVSLIKNVILIALLLLLLKLVPAEKNNYNHILSIIVTVIIIVAPFVIFPIGVRNMPLSLLYSKSQPEQPKEKINQGKHIVCFMSLTCPHCRDAATLIHGIKENNPDLPFYIFFPADEDDSVQAAKLSDFMQQTKATGIPYSFIKRETFIEMVKAAGEDGVPVILWLDDSTIVRKIEVPDLENGSLITQQIKEWLHSGK